LTNRETIELFDAEVVASEATLSQSKTVGKSAQEDLKRHERWLQRHAAAEARNREKHQRRLKHLKISQRRWVKRQRLLRSARQRATIIGATARSVALMLGDKTVSAASCARDQIVSAAAWSRPKLQAAADASYRAGNAGYAWLKVKAGDAGVQLSKASKIAAARGKAAVRELSKKGAIGFEKLSVKSHEVASHMSEQGNAALAWSRVKGKAVTHSAGNAASIGFEQAKLKSSNLAYSASKLTVATAVRARAYGSQALTSAKSWSEKAGESAQQLRASLAASATQSMSPTPVPSSEPNEPPAAAQVPEQRSIIELLNITPLPNTPAPEERISAPLDAQPKALAASALAKPSPPRGKPKPDKIKAKDKTHRGGRGGKKKHKPKSGKSKSQ
jgi:hypothetical protein